MGAKDLALPRIPDIESYKAPANYELAGKSLEFLFDGGERVSLVLSDFPVRELTVGGSVQKLRYECVKIDENILFLSYRSRETAVWYVIDTQSGAATRAVVGTSDHRAAIAFGALADGANAGGHAFSKELDGTQVTWNLGKEPGSVFNVIYKDGLAQITCPAARAELAEYSASDLQTVKINDAVFMQTARLSAGGGAELSVALLSNFKSVTCAGGIFDMIGPAEARHRVFGGYGRVSPECENLRKLSPFAGGGISQYTPPQNFELAGQSFELIMDDGYDYVLKFIDGRTLEWNNVGDRPKRESYLCQKGDDTTYLVSFELAGVSPRVNHTFVLDCENYLATRLISRVGTNPKVPYLINTEYIFGVIRREGAEFKTYPRHGYTSDLKGTVVQWAYGSEMATVHIYYCTDFYRITYPRDPAFSAEAEKMNEMFTNILKELPSSDEPTKYIKIKDGLYLFSLTEANGERILGAKMGFRSNTMCFLQNYRHVYQVGRAFGTSTTPEGDTYTHISFASYGKLTDPEGDEGLQKMLNDPNPYLI